MLARKKRTGNRDERSTLIACLEWQIDSGHDGWLKEGELGKATEGWEQADVATSELLESITRRTPSETKPQLGQKPINPPINPLSNPPINPPINPLSNPPINPPIAPSKPSAAEERGGSSTQKPRLQNRVNRQVDSATPLMPADAMLQAERLALSCNNLAELERAVLACELCPLHMGARHGVFAEGNPQSGLMIVGEAPGKEEDEQGKPFVGASGQLLMRMLSYIGISTREQYYITNLVYWRPPGNRTPSMDELLVCQPFFKRQVSLVRPRLLLLLGNVAAQTILREKIGITRLRGRFLEYKIDPAYELPAYKLRGSAREVGEADDNLATNNIATNQAIRTDIRTLATFHPSYLLRTPSKKAAAWHDLLLLRQAL